MDTNSGGSARSYSEGGEWREEIGTLRPLTATDRDDQDDHSDTDVMQCTEQRPFTTTAKATALQQRHHQSDSIQNDFTRDDTCMPSSPKTEQNLIPPHLPDLWLKSSSSSWSLEGHVVELCLIESWGDPGYIGLTGVELLHADTREPVSLGGYQLSASIEEGVAALVDGVNMTTEVDHMYLCLTTMMSSGHVTITLALDTPTRLYGMRIWNYNTSLEDTYKGVSK